MHSGLALGDGLVVDEVFGGRCQGSVQSDEIALGIYLLQIDFLDARFRQQLGRTDRIVPKHLHADSVGTGRDDLADPAAADYTDRFPVQLNASKGFAVPLPSFYRLARTIPINNKI